MINYIIQRNFLIQTFISKNANLLSFIVVNNDREVLNNMESDKRNK